MKTINVLGFVIGLILAFVSFYASSNVILGGGALIVSLLFYHLYVLPKLNKHNTLIQKLHECYFFINNFLISLSIKESLLAAFEAVSSAISDDFKEYLDSINELSPQEKLLYLKKYFPFHLYGIFVDIVILWIEQGGNILEMSNHVTNEMREVEEYISYSETIAKRKTFELIVLWIFSLSVVVVLRLSLNDFYGPLTQQFIFIASIALLVIVVLASIFFFVNRYIKIDVRGIDYGH
ncbi:MAG: hypothetical protein K6C32_02000 [Bacilli bacterium]|nr:hypothetical protein [Bacilli bacterium]